MNGIVRLFRFRFHHGVTAEALTELSRHSDEKIHRTVIFRRRFKRNL